MGTSGYALHQKMHVIFICAYLYKMHLVPLPYSHAYVRKRVLHFSGKHLSPILRRADEVVKQQRFVVSFEDMFTHTAILPRSRASRNSFD
jgi:hypothetical protein